MLELKLAGREAIKTLPAFINQLLKQYFFGYFGKCLF